MAGNQPYARIIREEELVAKRIDKAIKRVSRLGEMYDGIKWWLARNPLSGTKVSDSDHYIYKSYSWKPGGVPSITVLYKFDDDYIYIVRSRID